MCIIVISEEQVLNVDGDGLLGLYIFEEALEEVDEGFGGAVHEHSVEARDVDEVHLAVVELVFEDLDVFLLARDYVEEIFGLFFWLRNLPNSIFSLLFPFSIFDHIQCKLNQCIQCISIFLF